ncbi:PREDICTED: protein ENHANCED DISEASE RESISTANCE 4-like [Camelina sativa]|uniref:Protein ENHANCED DISEASE RESISTANCE 4-like n=1 Tax=Camelina sativa TaxID=90675 RepID=A0ABM0Z9Y7_CAMSA|nr:PREDICTED: protein ENHANCED DISEASE RESISTANCE 4-like [Camelina sativa]
MTESTKVRLVRCPKCENLLSEPEDSPFFQCGGCFTVLRAKIKEREAEADSVSDKSVEHGAKKPVSVNSTSSPEEKAIVDSSDETSSDSDVVPSSLRHQQNVPVLAVETDHPCCSKGEGDRSSILVDKKDDPKSQSGRQDSGLDQFRKRTTKRCDSDSVVINRLSTTSKYPCDEGPSSSSANNYFPDSVREFQKHLKDQSNEAIEQDRAGLLRQLEKLKEQLVQSCNVPGEKPKESLSSTGLLNKGPPMRFHSLGNHAVGGPSYYHQHTEPQFPYNNNSEAPHSLMHPSFGDPHRFQMHGRGPHPLQPSHPYYSGQYVGNNNNSHDLFDAYPQQNNGPFHNSSCSCYHCYENKYWRGSAPVIPDAPYNAGFYPHENVMGFAPPHNPRTYASRGLQQPHGRWPSNFTDTQMDSLSRIRPPRVVLPGGSRHIRPLAGGAPFITCQNCFELLQLPKKPEAGGTKKQQKVRCGACSCLIDLSVVNNKFVLSTNTASTRQGEARVAADYTSDDYDLLGYVFHSLDDEPRDLPGLISDKSSTDMQHVHSHSASLSEGELSSDSLTAKPLAQAQDSPLHDNYVDYSSINHDRSGAGSRSSRSEHDRVTQSKTTAMRQNSMKEVSLASEMEVNFNDYSQNHNNSGVSKDQQQRAKKSGFASIVKKSFKDLTKSINNNDEGNKSNVSINGHLLTERLLRKAEKQAGAIQPGNYWYDYRAGFWGVMGGPGLGILPPFIEEMNYTMPENCSGGTTGVFVNGRELHRKDLDLLAGRGLPPDRDRSYIVDITGRVIDEDTGEELDCLGKLAPTIEKLKRGFGMRLPKRAT